MTLSRFSRVMIGTKTYIDLLIELSSILDIKDFFIVVRRQGLNYRIKAIYDLNLNKLKYPKNFRKVIYDAEPEIICESEDEYGRTIPIGVLRRDFDGCILYRVKINGREGSISITDAYETVKQNHYPINICPDEGYKYGIGYSFYATAYATNSSYRWSYN